MAPKLSLQSGGQALLPSSHSGAQEGLTMGKKLARGPETHHATVLSLTLTPPACH